MELFKKYGGYIVVLIGGLLVGYLSAGGAEATEDHQHDMANEKTEQYSCAMHPQIQQAEMGKCPLCGMDLTIASINSGAGTNQFQMTETAMALANIETTEIGVGDLEGNTLILSGKIGSNEQTDAVQTSIFDGRIEDLQINYVGQYIKKGNKIGMIYAPEMYTAQDQLLTSASYKETHKKLFDQARNASGLWRMTDAQINQVLKTGKPISNFPIIADVSGTVTEVLASEGNFYKQGDPLFKVSNLYTVWAVFDAYENQLPLLKTGQEIRIGSDTFNGKEYKAKIAFIDPVLDAANRTVAVRATLKNKEGLLKPGMFIKGAVAVDLSGQLLTVPKSAVLWTGKRSLVYVKPDPTKAVFEMTEVTLGNVIGDSYAVLNGLSPGDEVVVNGTFTVDAAAQLQGKKSMMALTNNVPISPDGGMNFKGDFKMKFTAALHKYSALKDALVASKPMEVSVQAKQMFQAISEIDAGLLEEAIGSHLKEMKQHIDQISGSASLEEQRKAFKPLSENMVAIATVFSDLDQPIYVQYCPMADTNKGASWISFQNEIRNPYFGDAMLTCGSITKTIQ